MIKIDFQKLYPDVVMPEYKTEGSSGMDIHAYLPDYDKDNYQTTFKLVYPGKVTVFQTGFCVQLPKDVEIQIRPRSGLAINHGVTLVNSIGTVDSDYTGEIKVGLINLSNMPYKVHHGDRIAQMVLCPVVRMCLNEVASLEATGRGAGGFGHTGK